MARELTVKRKKFIKEYVKNDGNATEAVVRAGYNVKNRYRAAEIGSQLLKDDRIRTAIQEALFKQGVDENKVSRVLDSIIDESNLRKTTTGDVIKAIHLVSKLQDWFPVEKRAVARLDIKAEYEGMTIEELENELDRLREERQEIFDHNGLEKVVEGEVENEKEEGKT